MHTHTHNTHMHKHACTHMNAHSHEHMHTCTYTHASTHTHRHTYGHTHTHIHVPMQEDCEMASFSKLSSSTFPSSVRMMQCYTYANTLTKQTEADILYSRKFSSVKRFVKSDRQAVGQEFIFVKCRSSLVCSLIVRSSIFAYRLSSHSWKCFWFNTCGQWKN